MALESLFLGIEESVVGVAVRENAVLFPTLEVIHVIGLTLVVGSVAAIDLRLLGLSARSHAVTKMSAELLPWTWGAFALAAVSGLVLFTSAASSYVGNIAFLAKLALLVAAALNMMIFHFITWKSVHHWDVDTATPMGAKIAGGLSLLFWIGVVTLGRWVGFV